MMRKIVTFVLPVALAVGASGLQQPAMAETGAASGAKAERPDVKVGDRWKIVCTEGREKSELVRVVESVGETQITFTENGKPATMTRELNQLESARRKDSDQRRLSFPLEVGKQWEFTDKWLDHTSTPPDAVGSEKGKVKVVSYEKVRVPAGEFDTFAVKWNSSWNNGMGGSGITDYTYWYAPAARAIIKSNLRVTWQGGGYPDQTCEVVEFKLQP